MNIHHVFYKPGDIVRVNDIGYDHAGEKNVNKRAMILNVREDKDEKKCCCSDNPKNCSCYIHIDLRIIETNEIIRDFFVHEIDLLALNNKGVA